MYDVRGKAASILTGHKLRMLAESGIAVVDKQRLDALELLWNGLHDKVAKRAKFDAEACGQAIRTLIVLEERGARSQ